MPGLTILRSQPVNQILLHEHPAFSGFGAREIADAGALQHRLRMHLEQRGGLVQVKCGHAIDPTRTKHFRTAANAFDQPMRRFHSTPSATTR